MPKFIYRNMETSSTSDNSNKLNGKWRLNFPKSPKKIKDLIMKWSLIITVTSTGLVVDLNGIKQYWNPTLEMI